MSVYYPSCTAHIRLRFDEAFSVDESKTSSTASTINNVPVSGAKPVYSPLVLNADIRSDANKLNSILNRVPLSCSVELPAYRAAGSFKMEIEYADLPIDPRLARSASVEIYMGTVDPSDFSTGMVTVEPDGSRSSILNTIGPGNARKEDFLLGVFQVDSWHVSHTGAGSRVSLEGRDMRSIFLDTEIDVRAFKSLDLSLPIDKLVQQIISLHPYGKGNPKGRGGFTVHLQEGDFIDGVPKVGSTPFTKVRQKVADGSAVSKPQGGEKLNFWDLITKYCFLVGCIPYFQADRLFIRRSLDLFQQRQGDDPFLSGVIRKTPFAGGSQRTTETGVGFGVRRSVYGRDVLEYNFDRKLTGIKRPTIEIVSVDQGSKKRGAKDIRVRWPEKTAAAGARGVSGGEKSKKGEKVVGKVAASSKTSVSVSGQDAQEEIMRFPVKGITDKDQLRGIAKAIREEIMRGEMGGSITTKSLASFGTNPSDPVSGNRDPDMLRLRPGDAVEILVDTRSVSSQAPNVSSYTDSRRNTFDEEVKALEQKFGSRNIAADMARVIVAQSRGGILQLQTFFRVSVVRFEWAKDSGISISFDFQNYVEARDAVAGSNPQGAANPKSTDVSSVARTQEQIAASDAAIERNK